MNQMVAMKAFDPMTEAEARRVGHAATRIAQLRDLAKLATGGSIHVSTRNGSMSLAFTHLDIDAVLALLIEREGQLLSSMGVILQETPQ